MFVRFVAGTDDENAFGLDGIFTAAARLCNADELYRFEREWLEQVFTWFGENLPVPPFRRMHATGQWTQQAVSWFFDSAGEPLRRMWDLVALLREHGTPVRFLRAERPGYIVYSDRYQVVAETRKRAFATSR